RVATSASKKPRGIPLLEDIPYAGTIFRSKRTADGAFQDNIILADCVVYPTVFNLIGKEWFRGPESDPNRLIERERVEMARRSRIQELLISHTHREAEAIVGLPPLAPTTEGIAKEIPPAAENAEENPHGPNFPQIAEKTPTAKSEPPIQRLGYRTKESRKETSINQGWQKVRPDSRGKFPAGKQESKAPSNRRPPSDSSP
ncbi:MAG: hypothetical protein U1D30_21870, partial [Planctomycetota bacterium]